MNPRPFRFGVNLLGLLARRDFAHVMALLS